MTATNREAAIKITLGYEGGYTNHPSDPGGPTNWGITIHDARMYWKKDARAADVKAMPLSVAIGIYRSKYWNKMSCDNDPDGVDFATFDYGVNSGVGRAVPVRARTKNTDAVKWVKAICKERLAFLHRLKTWSVFGKGWGRRVADVEARGVKMALAGAGKSPEEVKKGLNDEAKDAAKKRNTEGAKTGGTVAGGAASQAPDSPAQLPDPTGFDWHTLLYVGCAVAVVGVVLYFGYRAYVQHQRVNAFTKVALE